MDITAKQGWNGTEMNDEPSFMALAVNRVLADFDQGFKQRTKPIRLIFDQIDGIWVPMLICNICGNGPITSLDDDSCCHPSSPIAMLKAHDF
jgi:hypothetical protein